VQPNQAALRSTLYNYFSDPQLNNNLINKGLSGQTELQQKMKAVIQQYNNRMVENRLIADKDLPQKILTGK